MSTPAQLRRVIRATLAAASDPAFIRDLNAVEDPEADQRLLRFYNDARGTLLQVITEELDLRHEWANPDQLGIEAKRWHAVGLGFETIVGWIKETPNAVAAQMLSERGWTPRLHRDCRIDGKSVAEILARAGMDPGVIPPLEFARAKRSAQKTRRRVSRDRG